MPTQPIRRARWLRCRLTTPASRRSARSSRAPVLATIDKLWKDLENDLNAIATDEQCKRHGRLAIGKVGRRPLDSELMDRLVPVLRHGGWGVLDSGIVHPPGGAGGRIVFALCLPVAVAAGCGSPGRFTTRRLKCSPCLLWRRSAPGSSQGSIFCSADCGECSAAVNQPRHEKESNDEPHTRRTGSRPGKLLTTRSSVSRRDFLKGVIAAGAVAGAGLGAMYFGYSAISDPRARRHHRHGRRRAAC